MKALETSRLLLCPLSQADAAGVQKHFPHWGIVQNLLRVVPWPYPADGAQQYIDAFLPKMAAGTDMIWSIRLKEYLGDSLRDEAIGIVHLHDVHLPVSSRGFWLAIPHQGRGYMSEAVTAVNDFAFDELKIEAFLIKTARGNRASSRVKEKTGAVLQRIEKAEGEYHGDFKEREVWSLTAADWRLCRLAACHVQGRGGE